jgi:hypothetical protein
MLTQRQLDIRTGERICEGFKKLFGNPMKAPKGRNVIAWGIAPGNRS